MSELKKNPEIRHGMEYYRSEALCRAREQYPEADESCLTDRYEIGYWGDDETFIDKQASYEYPGQAFPGPLSVTEEEMIGILVREIEETCLKKREMHSTPAVDSAFHRLTEERFLDLVRSCGGIEVTHGFRDDVDHFIGGTGSKLWYFVQKGTKADYYICTLKDGSRSDVHFTRKSRKLSASPAPEGKTLELILSELTAGQEEIEKDGRKPVKIELCGHPCSHYAFAFGERAFRILDEFGITAEYSDIMNEPAGFRLRNIVCGEAVKAPAET